MSQPTTTIDPCDNIIRLFVGSDEPIIVNVHIGVLCRTSEFFKRATKPEWASQRADENTIELPVGDINTVKIYAGWLYTGKVGIHIVKPTNNDGAKNDLAMKTIYVSLAKAYVFGEKVLDTKYKNAILQDILVAEKTLGYVMGQEAATIIYEGTTAGSGIRHLVCDFVAYNAGDHPSWVSDFVGYPRELLVDAIIVMSRIRARPTHFPFRTSGQEYLEKPEVQESCF